MQKSTVGFLTLAVLGTAMYFGASNLSFAANTKGKPDLKVVSVSSGFVIKNVSKTAAAPFWYQTMWIPVDYQNCGEGCDPAPHVSSQRSKSLLEPGESLIVDAGDGADFKDAYAVAILVDPKNEVHEKNEQNNSFIWFREEELYDPSVSDPLPVTPPPASSSKLPTIEPVFSFNPTIQYGKDQKIGGWLLKAPENTDFRVNSLCFKFQGTLPVSNISRLVLRNARRQSIVWESAGRPAFLEGNQSCFEYGSETNYPPLTVSSIVEPYYLELSADLTAPPGGSTSTNLQIGLGRMEYTGSNGLSNGRVSDYSFSSTYTAPPSTSSRLPTIAGLLYPFPTIAYRNNQRIGGWSLKAAEGKDFQIKALCFKFQGTLPVSNISRLTLRNARTNTVVWASSGHPAFLEGNRSCFEYGSETNYPPLVVSSIVEPLQLELYADFVAPPDTSGLTIQSGLGQMEYRSGQGGLDSGTVTEFQYSAEYVAP